MMLITGIETLNVDCAVCRRHSRYGVGTIHAPHGRCACALSFSWIVWPLDIKTLRVGVGCTGFQRWVAGPHSMLSRRRDLGFPSCT